MRLDASHVFFSQEQLRLDGHKYVVTNICLHHTCLLKGPVGVLLGLPVSVLQVEQFVGSREVRQQYPAVSTSVLLQALDRYKEAPGQAKKKPEWLTKKAAEAAVKQLKSPVV